MGRIDGESETFLPVAHSLRGEGFDASEDGTGRGTPLVPVMASAFPWQVGGSMGMSAYEGVSGTLVKNQTMAMQHGCSVRRLTPVECERLQGFPDGFTQIPYRGKPADRCPDGPRYKALGNSWAVNCADWLGERLAEVDSWTD
jgi:DNA (cytosine-5)-methyltransferase 1